MVCGAWLLTNQAVAAPVRVVVHLPQQSGPPSAAGYVCVENGVLPVVPPRRDPRREAMLLIEPVEPTPTAQLAEADAADGKAGSSATKKSSTVRIFGMRFHPEIIAATEEVPVVFRNDDRLPVTLLSVEAPRLFPTTPLLPGATLAVAIPAGLSTLSVRVLEHPQMRSTLLVPKGIWRHLKWSHGGDIGLVELDLPAGVYVTRVFFAHHYVASQALTVATDEPAAASADNTRHAASTEATEIVLRVAVPRRNAGCPPAPSNVPSSPDPSPANSGSVE